MPQEHFLSRAYIPDQEVIIRHRLVTRLCAFFDARDTVCWTPMLAAHLRVMVSELTDSKAPRCTHFERMFNLNLLLLTAENRRSACDLILEAIGLDCKTAEQFLLKGGWTRLRGSMEDFCEDAMPILQH